jgi:hypothetical protein
MFFRKIMGKEWNTLNDAFYELPEKSIFRGYYWFWLIQGADKKPKMCVVLQHFGVPYTMNDVKS